MSNEAKITELKLKNDISGLLNILKNEQDWMLSLDAAEALAQLGDSHGTYRLINALSDTNNEIRDVAKEILEGINDPQGNQALSQLDGSSDIPLNQPKRITGVLPFEISKHLEIIKISSFLVPLVVAVVGFSVYVCGDIFWPCLFMIPLSFLYFPLGLFEIPTLFFHGISFVDRSYFQIHPGIAMIFGWLIYFSLMILGAKVKSTFIFAIIYILFILLLLGNISGCTVQLSTIN